VDEEGKGKPQQAEEWCHCANNGSPLAAQSTAGPALRDTIQNRRQNACNDQSHKGKRHDRHENSEAGHRSTDP